MNLWKSIKTCGRNIFQKMINLNKFQKSYKNDKCWCTSWCKATRYNRTGSCIITFSKKYLQNLKYNVKQAYVCVSFKFGQIPSSLILAIKKHGGRGVLNGQNLLCVMKAICWWFPISIWLLLVSQSWNNLDQ